MGIKIRTLIVDDSLVFRSQIRKAFESDSRIEVVDSVSNGRAALAKLEREKIDLVILDLEMPELNGLDTLKQIRDKNYGCKTIVFSSHSLSGAKITMEALAAGAIDFVPKPSAIEWSNSKSIDPKDLLRELLTPKIECLFFNEHQYVIPFTKNFNWKIFEPKVIVIGCSTGGPTALEKIFTSLGGAITKPILVVQHMPPVFTASLSERIQRLSGIPCSEATDGEVIENNRIYIAPGNYHMQVGSRDRKLILTINQNAQENMVRPAVDPLFRSAAEHFRASCLAFVLTGMGKDGLLGSKELRSRGAPVVIQSKESCAVFGMPGALFDAGEFDSIQSLDEIAATISRYVSLNGEYRYV